MFILKALSGDTLIVAFSLWVVGSWCQVCRVFLLWPIDRNASIFTFLVMGKKGEMNCILETHRCLRRIIMHKGRSISVNVLTDSKSRRATSFMHVYTSIVRSVRPHDLVIEHLRFFPFYTLFIPVFCIAPLSVW